ncbi:MAG: hypothetical protein F4X97_16185 [Boseongicola sp. SB0662_bin_57]|nr:hypothetical protein [Boseongicola sp. SB0662_bin_57]
MTARVATLGEFGSSTPLRKAFLKWQCRVRQISMRGGAGRPDDAVTPTLYLPGHDEAFGRFVTVLNRAPAHSLTPEMTHMAARTNDPAQRRAAALEYFSAAYYQSAALFSDVLTATFPPGSIIAARIRKSQKVLLLFDAYAQRFTLSCRVWKLAPHNPLHEATVAHNTLFNPSLPPGIEVLGFEPDWNMSTSEPEIS